MADPQLFCIRFVKTRDLKIVAVSSLFVGGFVGRALLDKVGSSTTFLIGTGIRVLIALAWLGVAGMNPAETTKRKSKKSKKSEKSGDIEKAEKDDERV
jgi:hypothetical protein